MNKLRPIWDGAWIICGRLITLALPFYAMETTVLATEDQADTSPGGVTAAQQEPSARAVVPLSSVTGVPQPEESAAYKSSLLLDLHGRAQFNAELFAGLRYDTNANEAANTLAPGQAAPVAIPSALQSQADGSAVTKASVSHQYAFLGWPKTVWETNADISDQRFFQISPNYDLTIAQANTGPRYYLGQLGQGKVSVRPFGSFVWTAYNDQTYSSLYGGGASMEYRMPRWWSNLAAIGWYGNYQNTAFRPQTQPYTGPEWLISLSTTYVINSTMNATAALWWYQADGRSADFSRHGPAVSLSVEKSFLLMRRTAQLVAFGSVQRLLYGGPPPQTQALSPREDTILTGDLSLGVPISPSAAVRALRAAKIVFEYQYLRDHSNYFPFIDNAVTIGFKLPM
jgi:hypothetical protein